MPYSDFRCKGGAFRLTAGAWGGLSTMAKKRIEAKTAAEGCPDRVRGSAQTECREGESVSGTTTTDRLGLINVNRRALE